MAKQVKDRGGDSPIFAIFASVLDTSSVDMKALAAPMQVYACDSCGERWALNPQVASIDGVDNKVDPFCPHCGSAESELVQDPQGKVEDLSEATELASVMCECCSTTLVMSSAQKVLKGVIACPTCNTISTFAEAEDVEVNADGECPQDAVPVEAEDDEGGEVEDSTDDEGDEVEASDDADEEDAEEGDTDEEGDEVSAADDMADDADEEVKDDTDVEAAAPEFEGKAHDGGVMRHEVPVLSFTKESGKVQFYRLDEKVMASIDDITVASQCRSDISESRRDMFDSPSYMKALSSSVRSLGIAQTLQDFGFKKLTLSGVNDEVAKSHSEKRIQTVASTMAVEKTEAMVREFKNCLGIAAVALNKGFYGDKQNPTKAALASTLRSAGVRNPEAMIDKAFAGTSDTYNTDLLATAWELMQTPVEARNQIAGAVKSMKYSSGFRTVASDEDDEDESDKDDLSAMDTQVVESSLARPFLASGNRSRASVGIEPKGSAMTTVANVLKSRGGRLFSQ